MKYEINKETDNVAIRHRRNLHSIAEVGFELHKTREYISAQLKSMGYSPIVAGRSSILAVEKDREEYILLRADMDALPIGEETKLSFKSNNGCMHACGHDMHAAMLLTAAQELRKSAHSRKMGVIFLFQAAEENLQGAMDVIKSRALERYNVRYAVTVHVVLGLPFPAGTVIVPPPGIVAPGADVIRISINGKSAHGSTTHLGKNSIYAAVDVIETINRMILFEFPANEIRLINWGYFQGGKEANIVAETSELRANVRYINENVRRTILKRISEIIGAISLSSGCDISFEITGDCPPLENDFELIEKIRAALDNSNLDFIDANELKNRTNALGGSEDFAHFSKIYPSALISICAGNKESGHTHPLHTPQTDFDEGALCAGWRLFDLIIDDL